MQLEIMIRVLVRVPIAVIKHHNQKHLGDERVYFALTSKSLSMIKGSQSRDRSTGRAGAVLLIALLLLAHSVLYTTKTSYPGQHHPQVSPKSIVHLEGPPKDFPTG